jgi:protein phosphatase
MPENVSDKAGTSLVIGNHSHVGMVRPENEDYLGYYSHDGTHVVIVADGMGGHAGGKVASRVAVETIRDVFLSANLEAEPVFEVVARALRAANINIRSESASDARLKGMGATCAIAVVREGRLFHSHLGDCRVYFLRGGELKRITKDHTVVQRLLDGGIITVEEAKVHPEKNIVSRALGGREDPELDIPAEPIRLEVGDRFLLCSDGLFDLVTDEEILEIASKNHPQEACQKLVALANEKGGRDNVTVQIGLYTGP